jgi:predicted DNA-binding ribbon-helix-helix protein
MPHVDPSKGTHEIASHKRTVYIDGRKTGVCLEDAFWSTLKEIAQAQGVTVSQTADAELFLAVASGVRKCASRRDHRLNCTAQYFAQSLPSLHRL